MPQIVLADSELSTDDEDIIRHMVNDDNRASRLLYPESERDRET